MCFQLLNIFWKPCLHIFEIFFTYVDFRWRRKDTIRYRRNLICNLFQFFIFWNSKILFLSFWNQSCVNLWHFRKFSFNNRCNFQSYDFFKTRKRCYLISRSLHLCFWSILKISICFNVCHFSSFWGSELCAFWIVRFF